MACQIEDAVQDMTESESLKKRREMINEVDKKGIIATPANSYINELVVEAARISILNDGENVDIEYGDKPHVKLRQKNELTTSYFINPDQNIRMLIEILKNNLLIYEKTISVNFIAIMIFLTFSCNNSSRSSGVSGLKF